jgi:hypothetical protein
VWLLAEDGHVPHDAVAFKFRSKHAYFCQVQDANSVSKQTFIPPK